MMTNQNETKRTLTRALLLKRLYHLQAENPFSEWCMRYEKNGIGDYGRDEHYRAVDNSFKFGLRITFNPPSCTVLYFVEVRHADQQ